VGGRLERQRVGSDGATDNTSERFGAPRQRLFDLGSAALGASRELADGVKASANLSYSERAPSYFELFANGPHGATGAYEVGDPAFKRERVRALDLVLNVKQGTFNGSVSVFAQQFGDYPNLVRTGVNRDADGNGGAGIGVTDCGDGTSRESACAAEILPEFRYRAISARFTGLELEGRWTLRPGTVHGIELSSKLDYVRAADLTNRAPLARIAPLRVQLGLAWRWDAFSARLDLTRAFAQRRVSPDDSLGSTDAYTLLNLGLTYEASFGRTQGIVFLRGTNLGNQSAFNASSIDTIRSLAPLPGRALKAGVQFSF
jgi:iron complex outermembrane receptor protein